MASENAIVSWMKTSFSCMYKRLHSDIVAKCHCHTHTQTEEGYLQGVWKLAVNGNVSG